MNTTNWNWNQHYSYSWGYWMANHPRTAAHQSVDYDPCWWAGFAHGTVEYWLRRKGLK